MDTNMSSSRFVPQNKNDSNFKQNIILLNDYKYAGVFRDCKSIAVTIISNNKSTSFYWMDTIYEFFVIARQ